MPRRHHTEGSRVRGERGLEALVHVRAVVEEDGGLVHPEQLVEAALQQAVPLGEHQMRVVGARQVLGDEALLAGERERVREREDDGHERLGQPMGDRHGTRVR